MGVRDWRKLYASITSSDRLSRVSYEARWLFICLLAHQDDAGMFGWTPPKVREVTATCDWTYAQAAVFLSELAAIGLVVVDGDMVAIRRGSELNGVPSSGSRTWLEPRFYQGSTAGIPVVYQKPTVGIPAVEQKSTVGIPLVSLGEEGRGEERKGREENTSSLRSEVQKPKRKTPQLSGSERSELHASFDAVMSSERVEEEIEAALDHEAAYKRGKSGSWKLYVQAWLRRSSAPSQPRTQNWSPKLPASPTSEERAAEEDQRQKHREYIARLAAGEARMPISAEKPG